MNGGGPGLNWFLRMPPIERGDTGGNGEQRGVKERRAMLAGDPAEWIPADPQQHGENIDVGNESCAQRKQRECRRHRARFLALASKDSRAGGRNEVRRADVSGEQHGD